VKFIFFLVLFAGIVGLAIGRGLRGNRRDITTDLPQRRRQEPTLAAATTPVVVAATPAQQVSVTQVARNGRRWIPRFPTIAIGLKPALAGLGLLLTAAFALALWMDSSIYDAVIGQSSDTGEATPSLASPTEAPTQERRRPFVRLVPEPAQVAQDPAQRKEPQSKKPGVPGGRVAPQSNPPNNTVSGWWAQAYDAVIGQPLPEEERTTPVPPPSRKDDPSLLPHLPQLPSLSELFGGFGVAADPTQPLHVWRVELSGGVVQVPPYTLGSAVKITPAPGACVIQADEFGNREEVCNRGQLFPSKLQNPVKFLALPEGKPPVRVAITECPRNAPLQAADPDRCD
jgi:hypothetical protein